MENFILLYVIFALTTTITAAIELFWPVIAAIKVYAPELLVIKHTAMTLTSLMLIAFIAAPLIFLPCIIPSMGDRFRKSLQLSLEQQ